MRTFQQRQSALHRKSPDTSSIQASRYPKNIELLNEFLFLGRWNGHILFFCGRPLSSNEKEVLFSVLNTDSDQHIVLFSESIQLQRSKRLR